MVAGMPGFEPGNGGIKRRILKLKWSNINELLGRPLQRLPISSAQCGTHSRKTHARSCRSVSPAHVPNTLRLLFTRRQTTSAMCKSVSVGPSRDIGLRPIETKSPAAETRAPGLEVRGSCSTGVTVSTISVRPQTGRRSICRLHR